MEAEGRQPSPGEFCMRLARSYAFWAREKVVYEQAYACTARDVSQHLTVDCEDGPLVEVAQLEAFPSGRTGGQVAVAVVQGEGHCAFRVRADPTPSGLALAAEVAPCAHLLVKGWAPKRAEAGHLSQQARMSVGDRRVAWELHSGWQGLHVHCADAGGVT